jgi:hypothetical protein
MKYFASMNVDPAFDEDEGRAISRARLARQTRRQRGKGIGRGKKKLDYLFMIGVPPVRKISVPSCI